MSLPLSISNSSPATGPVTPRGKRISSRNSFKHGIYASPASLQGDDRAHYNRLLRNYRRTFHPATPEEQQLTRELALLHFRHDQAQHLETAVIDHRIQMQLEAESLTQPRDEAHATSLWAGIVTGDDFPKLKTVWQRQDRLTRQLERTRKQLRELVSRRQAETTPVRPAAKPKTDETNSPLTAREPLEIKEVLAKIERQPVPKLAPAAAKPLTRNGLCSCGSGKKYKRCCGRNAPPVLFLDHNKVA